MKVSVIIPHAGGREILTNCLTSLMRSVGVEYEVIIVDNGSDDAEEVSRPFPHLHILRFERKLGFSVACNRGVNAATGEYIFLLNNDAVVESDSMRLLVEELDNDDNVAACQPKILSLLRPGYFDYSSAAGGEIDRYGYPFARGRIFDTVEKDKGQYDDKRDIFWGAGAALMIRRDVYLKAGGLEERYFAHMEEIDLLWRVQLMGYRVRAVPQSVVRHMGAVTIKTDSFAKMYLNHRNSLATIFRNYSVASLARNLPIRLILENVTLLLSLFRLDFTRFGAVLRAECWFLVSLPYLIRSRYGVQRLRRIPDEDLMIYQGSIIWDYFVRKRQTWRELNR